VSDLTLVGTVVIHHPDFFVAGAVADEINLTFSDAGDTPAKSGDDFIRKSMGDDAGRVVGGDVGILFADHQRRCRVPYVVEPPLHGEFARSDTEIAKGQHGGLGGGEFHTPNVTSGGWPGTCKG